ncbi:response regulator transcription factor [Maribacter sp. ANRC-HE7]|uniref:Response regulator transcription factor n=1 Tax=Maribacter aquimaris TaxID=2737171 RepID=A0ABR7V384_9FLAO|nr:LytTR family DNA-binding domain-containing protein [Maribacter aquimaris]MBD0777603.1 response regulator transcription factor [Maribacter aquimaris]
MMRAIIVDDEPAAIKSLIWELDKFSDYIKIVDTFTSANEALSGINYLKPDCVFLDIEMPEMNGFSLLQRLQFRNFAVIITTAYSQYALRAIKESALDYLLKPIDSDEIKKVVEKLEKYHSSENFQNQFVETLGALSKASTPKMIQIPVNGKILFARIDDILYCESDGNYSKIFLESSKELYAAKKLKELEQLLPVAHFFRIHNSYIVHTLKVTEFLRAEGYVVLTNNKKIPVSRNKKVEFLNKMSY